MLAGERLSWAHDGERLVYALPKPRPDAPGVLTLTPFELLDRIAVLIPPPRRHRHRYHGVLAPNAALRASVTAYAGQPITSSFARDLPQPAHPLSPPTEPPSRSPALYLWAALLARIYDCLPLTCPRCGSEMTLIAFVTEPGAVSSILEHLGLPTEPPQVAPARAPPHPGHPIDHTPLFDPTDPDPDPGYEFDQRVSW